MSQLQPSKTDVVLSAKTSPPINGAVLGGVAGIEHGQIRLSMRFGESYHLFRFETVKIDKDGTTNDQIKYNYFFTEYLDQNFGIEMVNIPAGAFLMGFDESFHEQPVHEVKVSEFHISKYPINQGQYRSLMGKNPAFFQGDDLAPIENVSWDDAQKFCQILSNQTGKNYRLPSEAQWEYACRGGTNTLFAIGDILNNQLANFSDGYIHRDNSPNSYHRRTTPVGSFVANNFGLYDMHGNVWEWCQDMWHKNYQRAPMDCRVWESDDHGNGKVIRGGSWLSDPWFCRSANRNYLSPASRNYSIGFRIVLALNEGSRHFS
jgi:eukaryotic-like serine/threonine-protein kinase